MGRIEQLHALASYGRSVQHKYHPFTFALLQLAHMCALADKYGERTC